MADNLNKKIADLEKKLKRIEFLSKQLGKNIDTVNLQPIKENAGAINELFENLEQQFYKIGQDSDYLVSQFSQLAGEIKNTQSGVNKAAGAFRGLSSIAQQISNYQKGITDLTTKQIQKLRQQTKEQVNGLKTTQLTLQVEKEELENRRNSLSSEKAILDEKLRVSSLTSAEFQKQKELSQQLARTEKLLQQNVQTHSGVVDALDQENAALGMLNSSLDEAEQRSMDLKDAMGLSGAAVEGLQEGLQKAGFGKLASRLGLDEAKDKMNELAKKIVDGKKKEESLEKLITKATGETKKELQKELELLKQSNKELSGSNSKFTIMKEGLKSMGASFMKNLLDPAAIFAMLLNQFIKAFKKADSGAGDLAKNMNMTYSQALQTRKELGRMADNSGDVALNVRGLQESLTFVNQSLGTNGELSEETLATFTKLREQAGMTNEQIMSMQKFTMATGGELKGNVQKFQAAAKIMTYQKGVAINTKQLMADMGKLSNATKLSIKGGAEALAEQMVRVKAVGLEMEKLNGIASKMLDFESRIEDELQAELLTGKSLNFEKARSLALDNDLAGMAEEIAAQVGGIEEFQSRNRIQQEAMAKAAGMTREEMADMLVEQKALESVGGRLNDKEREAYEAYKKKHGVAAAAKMLEEGQLDNMTQQLSVQKRMAQAVEKLQEIFVRIAEPILAMVSPIIDLLIPALQLIPILMSPIVDAFTGISGILSGDIESLNGWQKAMGIIAITAGSIYAITKGIAVYNGIIKGMKVAQIALEAAGKAGILGTIGALTTQLMLQMGIMSAAMATNAAVTFGVGVAVAVAAAAAGYAAIKAMTADDLFSSPTGYGKRTLVTDEGAFHLNNKDSVIAGTDLFKNDTMDDPGKSSQPEKQEPFKFSSRDPKPPKPAMNRSEALQEQNLRGQRELIALVREGQNVNYDSFGTATSTSVFNVK